MRLTIPRIVPVVPGSEAETDRIPGPTANITQTLVNHPVATKAWLSWANYVLSDRNTLTTRHREIVILRTAFLCRAGYSWAHHTRIALAASLTHAEIARIKLGAEVSGWSEAEKAVLRAADDLHREQFVTQLVWDQLAQHLSLRQCMDVVFSAAQYTSNAMILNSFGVQLDPGLELDSDLATF
jgi:alkylhydroperoxidase family enzyme